MTVLACPPGRESASKRWTSWFVFSFSSCHIVSALWHTNPAFPIFTQVAARPETPEPTTATLILPSFATSSSKPVVLKNNQLIRMHEPECQRKTRTSSLRGRKLRERGSMQSVHDVGIESIVRLASWIPHSCRSWSAPLPLTLSLTLYFRGLLYNFMVP